MPITNAILFQYIGPAVYQLVTTPGRVQPAPIGA